MQTPDEALTILADYVCGESPISAAAYHTARLALADSLGCAILALKYEACRKLLGPVMPGTVVPHGARVPGTRYELDPLRAAFNIGLMIRWLDYNDTWLAKEWGHPSDNLGGLLALGDTLCRTTEPGFSVKHLLEAMVRAYEIQGGLALLNSFNQVGLDHVILVKVATAAVGARMWGCSRSQVLDALSNAWIDSAPLRTYRHWPNTGSRKSWAAGDATSRGLFFAWLAAQGEMGYPTALSAKQWGFYDVCMQGKPFQFERPLECYVMENVLFKLAGPAEYHAQTAVEAAMQLHPLAKWDAISEILIETQQPAMRIINKNGSLTCPADRDHCLQYMAAVALLKGKLTAEDYEEEASQDPRIDQLRSKMRVREELRFTQDYYDPKKRAVPNALTLQFSDGTPPQRVQIDYPLGHPKRRQEAVPLLFQKFEENLRTLFPAEKVNALSTLFQDHNALCAMPLDQMLSHFLLE
jgi:2-methylcitrate dehydratase